MTSTTKQAPAILMEGNRITDPKDLHLLVKRAQSYVLPGWDTNQKELRRQYEGHLTESLAAAMGRRFPATAHRMPNAPMNFAASIANSLASVYDEGCQRCLLREDGEEIDADYEAPKPKLPPLPPPGQDGNANPLPPDGVDDGEAIAFTPEEVQAAKDFQDMLREARLDVVMPEVDRRVSLTGTVFLHIRSDSVEAMALARPPRTVVDIFWAPDVLVIPHPLAPSVLQASLALLVRVAGDGGVGPGVTTWVHWRRDVAFQGGQIVGLGAWRADLVRLIRTQRATLAGLGPTATEEKIEVSPMWDPYPLARLPFVAVHRGIPAGSPYVDANRYLPQTLSNMNATMMAEIHTVDHSTAPVWVHKTDQPQPKNVVLAPGTKANILTTEELTSEPQQADLAGIRATTREHQETLANTLRTNTQAFVAEQSGIPSSGLALRIQNIPQEKARKEAVAQSVPMEQEDLLPGLVEVHDHFRGTRIGENNRRYKAKPGDTPFYESPKEKQDRLAAAVAAGWIDDAAAAVAAGFYKTVEEAQKAIDRIKEEQASKAVGMSLLDQPGELGGGDGAGDSPAGGMPGGSGDGGGAPRSSSGAPTPPPAPGTKPATNQPPAPKR